MKQKSPASDGSAMETRRASNVNGKHFYRFKYLRSDHWQNLRLEKLVQQKARCEVCKLESIYNDVHHLNYRNLYDVQLPDLMVLCRGCHEQLHEFLNETEEKLRTRDDVISRFEAHDLHKKLNGVEPCETRSDLDGINFNKFCTDENREKRRGADRKFFADIRKASAAIGVPKTFYRVIDHHELMAAYQNSFSCFARLIRDKYLTFSPLQSIKSPDASTMEPPPRPEVGDAIAP